MKSPNPYSTSCSADERRRRTRARRMLVNLEQVHLSHYGRGLHERRER